MSDPGVDAQITFCYTPDLEGTAAFYADVVGLPLVLDQGACRIFRVREGAYLGFCRRDGAPRPEGVILTLVSDDVDGWYRDLRARGAQVDEAPSHNDTFGIYHFFVNSAELALPELS